MSGTPGRPPTGSVLSSFERDQIAQAVAAVRSGDPRQVRRTLAALNDWPAGRSLVALGSLCERYLHHLGQLGLVDFAGDGDQLRAMLESLAGEIPTATRPSVETLFRALTVTMVPSSPAAQEIVRSGSAAILVGLLQLAGGLVARSGSAPSGLLPGPAGMIRDVVAPE